jgi:hypothetical protein
MHMTKISIWFLFFLFTAGLQAQDLQSVLDKIRRSLGIDARKAIPVLETSGHFIMNGTDAKMPFTLIQQRPDLLRVETILFGFKAIQTYDGTVAWMLTPTQGLEAVKTDARDMEFIAAATSIDGPFAYNKDDKYTLRYLGKDTYNGQEAEVVAWTSSEERLKYYVNPDTWLIDAVRYEYKKNGGWYSMEYRIKAYMEYKGAHFPSEIAALVNGVEMINLYVKKLNTLEKVAPEQFGKPSYMM